MSGSERAGGVLEREEEEAEAESGLAGRSGVCAGGGSEAVGSAVGVVRWSRLRQVQVVVVVGVGVMTQQGCLLQV